MRELTITDVRAVPGDSAFLIDDGTTAILYDTGFGFTGDAIAGKIRTLLGSRSLDYLFLTHSHYDHALGTSAIVRHFPQVKVVASGYARRIFEKPTALAVMLEMDRKAAAGYGMEAVVSDSPRVDITVEDGDELVCGSLRWQVIALPGHTRCSVGYWLASHQLLLSTETLGVRFDNGTCLPSFLVGYQMTLQSFRKAKELQPRQILLPHLGLLCDQAGAFLNDSENVTVAAADLIRHLLAQGMDEDAVLEQLTQTLYLPHVEPVYPRDAFLLNTGIMIRLIKTEFNTILQ